MFNIGNEVEIYGEGHPNDYNRENIARVKELVGFTTTIARAEVTREGRNRYLLEIGMYRMWWFEDNIRLVESPTTVTLDNDLYTANTYVKYKNNPDLFIITYVKPASPLLNADYQIKSLNKGFSVIVRHNDLVLVANEELYNTYGINNIQNDVSPLPNPFKDYKYPLIYVNHKSGGYRAVVGTTPDGRPVFGEMPGETFKQNVIVLEDKETVDYNKLKERNCVYYINNKLTFKPLTYKTLHPKNNANWLEQAIIDLCTVKIKDFKQSVNLFGHGNKKKYMYEYCTKGGTYKIKSIILGHLNKKTNTPVNVVELFNGEISLKFKLEDLEFVLPDLKGYTPPKNRTIIKDSMCKISNNKHVKLAKGAKVRVLEITNTTNGNAKPSGKANRYSKSSIVKVISEDNKTYTCRIKNLRKL